MVAEIERVTAAHASALARASTAGVDDGAADAVSPPKAKRKKYKLDSSDGEVDNGASAAAVKGKGKARAASGAGEARRVKGKGKERSATADGGESDGGPAPAKRKRKTAEEIVSRSTGLAVALGGRILTPTRFDRPSRRRPRHGRGRTRPRRRRVARCVSLRRSACRPIWPADDLLPPFFSRAHLSGREGDLQRGQQAPVARVGHARAPA